MAKRRYYQGFLSAASSDSTVKCQECLAEKTSGKDLGLEVLVGEVSPDSRGGADSAIKVDVISANVQLVLQSPHELRQPSLLRGRGLGEVEVADQADADAVAIDIVGPGSETGGQLLSPSLADLDFPVAAPVAVPDDEMIRQAAA